MSESGSGGPFPGNEGIRSMVGNLVPLSSVGSVA